MSNLYEQMRMDMQLRGFSPKTYELNTAIHYPHLTLLVTPIYESTSSQNFGFI